MGGGEWSEPPPGSYYQDKVGSGLFLLMLDQDKERISSPIYFYLISRVVEQRGTILDLPVRENIFYIRIGGERSDPPPFLVSLIWLISCFWKVLPIKKRRIREERDSLSYQRMTLFQSFGSVAEEGLTCRGLPPKSRLSHHPTCLSFFFFFNIIHMVGV